MMEIAQRSAFRLRFHLAPYRFYNPIDAVISGLYLQTRYISSEAWGKLPSNEIRKTVKIPLDLVNSWSFWPFENPI
jgi:hypothetical protein